MNWLNRLRQKPKHVLDNYAFFATCAVVAVIAGVWSLSLPVRFAGVFANFDQNGQAANALQGVGEPITNISDTSKDFLQSLNDLSTSLETQKTMETETTLSNEYVDFTGYEDYLGDHVSEDAAASGTQSDKSSVNNNDSTNPKPVTTAPVEKREVRIATTTSQ